MHGSRWLRRPVLTGAVTMLLGTGVLVLGAADSTSATPPADYTWDCIADAPDPPTDSRSVNEVELTDGQTITIDVSNCDWYYTYGAISPQQVGGAIEGTQRFTVTGESSIHVYVAGTYGYEWTFVLAGAPDSSTSTSTPEASFELPWLDIPAAQVGTPFEYCFRTGSIDPEWIWDDGATGELDGLPTGLELSVNDEWATDTDPEFCITGTPAEATEGEYELDWYVYNDSQDAEAFPFFVVQPAADASSTTAPESSTSEPESSTSAPDTSTSTSTSTSSSTSTSVAGTTTSVAGTTTSVAVTSTTVTEAEPGSGYLVDEHGHITPLDGQVDDDEFIVGTTDIGILLCGAGPDDASMRNGTLWLTAGGDGHVEGYGFQPDGPVQIWIYSTGRLLTTVNADAAGNFTTDFPVPADLDLGAHTVMASGRAQDDTTRAVAAGVLVVDEPSSLPLTGSGSAGLLLALGAALIGMGLLLVVRRSQLTTTR